MNYSTDTFIIDVGQYLQTIMFKAPYINGKPLSYDQTRMLFNAVHESIFNSIFPWANINNHPFDAIEKVYENFQIRNIVDGDVYQYLGEDNQGNPQYSKPIPYAREQHHGCITASYQTERELPVRAPLGSFFLVGGDTVTEQWVVYLIQSILEPIGLELKNAILRSAGTRRKFEWHFEYVSNGIFYQIASSKPAVISIHKPVSEYELVNRAVLNEQAKPGIPLYSQMSDHQALEAALKQLTQMKPVVHESKFTVDLRPYSSVEQFGNVLQQAVSLITNPNLQGSKVNIVVTYTVEGYFNKLVSFINQFIEDKQLNVVVSFKADWIRPTTQAIPSADHRVTTLVNQMDEKAEQLRQIRFKIVKDNHISELQGVELMKTAPELYRMGFTPQDMAELMNVDDPTMRFYGKDPMILDQHVIMMCMAIDRYLEGGTLPQAVPVSKPVSEIPLAALNMNNLLIQELQQRLLSLDPNDKDYAKLYNGIVAQLSKLGSGQ